MPVCVWDFPDSYWFVECKAKAGEIKLCEADWKEPLIELFALLPPPPLT